jgi:hypothetical protein
MNNFMTLTRQVEAASQGTKMEPPSPLEETWGRSSATARAARNEEMCPDSRRLQLLRNDWRMLASEWLELDRALEQFQNEFERTEEDFNIRWKRRMGGPRKARV